MDVKTLERIPSWEWPENAGEIILKVLRDKNSVASDRVLAATLAGEYDVIGEELIAELHSIVKNKDEDELLRCRAAVSLAPALENADLMGFDDPEDTPVSEKTFQKVRKTLRKIYMDSDTSKTLRRKLLEASVRAPEEWHRETVAAAYREMDQEWKLTSVFCMRYVRGFEKQILESLESKNPEVEYQAVKAAGAWEIDRAWTHIASLVNSKKTEKKLLFAAIESAAFIRPEQAEELLSHLLLSDDQEIVEAVYEALALSGEEFEDSFYDDDI